MKKRLDVCMHICSRLWCVHIHECVLRYVKWDLKLRQFKNKNKLRNRNTVWYCGCMKYNVFWINERVDKEHCQLVD